VSLRLALNSQVGATCRLVVRRAAYLAHRSNLSSVQSLIVLLHDAIEDHCARFGDVLNFPEAVEERLGGVFDEQERFIV